MDSEAEAEKIVADPTRVFHQANQRLGRLGAFGSQMSVQVEVDIAHLK